MPNLIFLLYFVGYNLIAAEVLKKTLGIILKRWLTIKAKILLENGFAQVSIILVKLFISKNKKEIALIEVASK